MKNTFNVKYVAGQRKERRKDWGKRGEGSEGSTKYQNYK